MRYFMYKYKIQEYNWNESINIIYKIIDNYMLSDFNVDIQWSNSSWSKRAHAYCLHVVGLLLLNAAHILLTPHVPAMGARF